MKRFLQLFVSGLLLFVCLVMGGCVTYHDRYGNVASQSEEFDCDQKCGVYDTNMNAFGSAHCKVNCMHAKGYR